MMDASGINAWGDQLVVEGLRSELAIARARIAELETALGNGFIAPLAFELTPMEERLLGLLMALPRVSIEQAAVALYDDAHRAMVQPNLTIRVFMQHIRTKLRRHGINVNNIYGCGWAVPALDKERIIAMTGGHCWQRAAE